MSQGLTTVFTDVRNRTLAYIRPRILCAVDFTPQNRAAVDWAIRLARLSDADLWLVHAVSRSDSFSRSALARIRDVARLRDEARAQGVPVCVSVQHGRAAGVIALHARRRNVQLIVLGTNGRRGWNRLTVGSIAEQVLRRVPTPVFVVPTDAQPGDVRSTGPILCAVDFSPGSHAALAEAVRLARAQDSRLTVLHVVRGLESLRTSQWNWRSRVPEYIGLLMRDAREQLTNALFSRGDASATVDPHIVTGVPYREILRTAGDIDASLVIVGASPRRFGRLRRSTTARIVREASVPVLVVPQANADRSQQSAGDHRSAA